MAGSVTNELLLETLQAIQSKLFQMADDVVDLKTDMRGVKGHMAAFTQSEVALASIQFRLDRIGKRLSRID